MIDESIKRLALQSIRRPVKYDSECQCVVDRDNEPVCEVRGWGRIQYMVNPELRHDAIGLLVAELINACEDE